MPFPPVSPLLGVRRIRILPRHEQTESKKRFGQSVSGRGSDPVEIATCASLGTHRRVGTAQFPSSGATGQGEKELVELLEAAVERYRQNEDAQGQRPTRKAEARSPAGASETRAAGVSARNARPSVAVPTQRMSCLRRCLAAEQPSAEDNPVSRDRQVPDDASGPADAELRPASA